MINRKLPRELLLRIFSFLDIVTLCRCAQVLLNNILRFLLNDWRLSNITDIYKFRWWAKQSPDLLDCHKAIIWLWSQFSDIAVNMFRSYILILSFSNCIGKNMDSWTADIYATSADVWWLWNLKLRPALCISMASLLLSLVIWQSLVVESNHPHPHRKHNMFERECVLSICHIYECRIKKFLVLAYS